MPGPKPPGSKKARPSFDVARDPIPDSRSGWVYRSDPPQGTAPGSDLPQAATAASAPRAAAGAGRRFEPDAPPPAGRGWLATGLYIMALPVTLGMSLMFAPVTWLLGGRPQR